MESSMIPQQIIESKIYLLRGKKVMLDKDLAALYGVETFNLNKAVKRNIDRFPEDFMFQLNNEEFKNLIFHFGISSWGGTRKFPYAFTENGVAMLSSVLNSKRAITVNIQIMRTFTKIREMLISNAELARKIESLEKKYDSQFKVVFDAIRQLMTPPETKKRKIGFEVRERRARYGTPGRKSAKVLRS
ncbi:MAG: ORF6N domain-containing protein [Planctomycetota bacterium]